MTWNAGASMPRDLHGNPFIENVIHAEQPPELLVFGFQELVDLEDKKITASAYIFPSVHFKGTEADFPQRVYF